MKQRSELLQPFSTPEPDAPLRQRTLSAALAAGEEHESESSSWLIRVIDRLGTSRVARWSWATAMGLLLLANLLGAPGAVKRSDLDQAQTQGQEQGREREQDQDQDQDLDPDQDLGLASLNESWWDGAHHRSTLAEVTPQWIDQLETAL